MIAMKNSSVEATGMGRLNLELHTHKKTFLQGIGVTYLIASQKVPICLELVYWESPNFHIVCEKQ